MGKVTKPTARAALAISSFIHGHQARCYRGRLVLPGWLKKVSAEQCLTWYHCYCLQSLIVSFTVKE